MTKKRPKKLTIRVETNKKTNRGDDLAVLEKKKLILMQVGVAGFMVIFFTAWIFSLKYQFKANAVNNKQNSFNWEQTKTELNKAMGQVKQGMKEIKQIQATKQVNTLPREPELTAEQINLLKGKLINEIATGTATSTKKQNN